MKVRNEKMEKRPDIGKSPRTHGVFKHFNTTVAQ